MFRGKDYHPPELHQLGAEDSDKAVLFVHGVCDSWKGAIRLGEAMGEDGTGVHSYKRSRDMREELLPRRRIGNGVLQAAGAEMLLELLKLTEETDNLTLACHSMGSPIALAGLYDLSIGNFAPIFNKADQVRLEELHRTIGVNLIAPAGITNNTRALPGSGFAGPRLAQVVGIGVEDVVNDSGGLLKAAPQATRLADAAGYMAGHPITSLRECKGACCNPHMHRVLSNLESGRVRIFAYENDPLFGPEDIIYSLQNPSARDPDGALVEALKLNPRRARELASESCGGLNDSEKRRLAALVDSTVKMEGGHTTAITKVGAEALAPRLVFGSTG